MLYRLVKVDQDSCHGGASGCLMLRCCYPIPTRIYAHEYQSTTAHHYSDYQKYISRVRVLAIEVSVYDVF